MLNKEQFTAEDAGERKEEREEIKKSSLRHTASSAVIPFPVLEKVKPNSGESITLQ